MWIDIPPKDTVALINETVELECKGRGDPEPTITWSKDGQVIDVSKSARHTIKSSGSLWISKSQKSDSGEYSCEAANNVAKKTAKATLRVLSKSFQRCSMLL